MNEVKIQIPNNCELIKDGNTYIVREKKQDPPRSWKEFCENYPIKKGEAYIDLNSVIDVANCRCSRNISTSKNWCTSKEEAEAFLALTQLRQLRKAWVGDWEPSSNGFLGVIFYDIYKKCINTNYGVIGAPGPLSFPTEQMAKDFLNCFRDLCETAKILL